MRGKRPVIAAAASLLVAGFLVTATPAPPAGAAKPTVVIYGDSLIGDAIQYVDYFFGMFGRYRVIHREQAGAALCDYFRSYETEPPDVTVVVIAFTGNAFTPCMQNRDWLTAYQQDAEYAARVYGFERKRVVWAIPPNRAGEPVTNNPIG